MYGGGGGSGAGQLRAEQQSRERKIREGTGAINQQFASFTPGFYDARAQAYEQFALPSLSDEYIRSRRNLGYGLADRGLYLSSAGNEARASLERAMQQQKRAIADEGFRQGQSLRGEVEQNRSNLLNQLHATLDPSLAQSQAIASASQLRAPSPFAPVGGFLNDWSNIYLAKRLADVYRPVTEQSGLKTASFGAPAPQPFRRIG